MWGLEMLKPILCSMTLVVEIYGTVILGAIYTNRQELWCLLSLIGAFVLTTISSMIFTWLLREEKTTKVDHSQECPYFIDIGDNNEKENH